jgi:hypothetical protein
MGKKIFISYKYLDSQVQEIPGQYPTTARHYVDAIYELIDEIDHIYKGEKDNEDIGSLGDATIGSKLGNKIFESTVTIVLISKGMKENIPEKDQWIPWEISYSLKEQSRQGGRSKTNAVLAVVIPDENGNYDHFIKEHTCPYCKSRTILTYSTFQIIRENMFNIKNPVYTQCENHVGNTSFLGFSSYIHTVKWSDFIKKFDEHIQIADKIRQNHHLYELVKTIK